MAFPHDGKKFKEGESGNPGGRPHKYISTLKAHGYTKSEATDCIQVLISMDADQLKVVAEEEGHTILEQIVADMLHPIRGLNL